MARKSIYKKINLRTIIKSGETSRSDLEALCNKLFPNVKYKIVWLKDYDESFKGPQIINMGSPVIGGTHWIASYNNKYFDSFGISPPPKLSGLEWIPFQIQNIRSGHCGQYVVLWLYYMIIGEEDRFYNQFCINI